MATTTKTDETTGAPAETQDGPLLDLTDQAVKRLIKVAKQRGYVTYDELNEVLPSEEVSSEKIEDTMSMLSDMGINVVDAEEAEEAANIATEEDTDAEETRAIAPAGLPVKTARAGEPTERTDDPVRMYLREMGSPPPPGGAAQPRGRDRHR